MGICFASLSKVGIPPEVDCSGNNPPPLNRAEIYADLETYLFESFGWVYELQQTFADGVIQSRRMISMIRNHVKEKLAKSKVIKPLSNDEAEQILIQIYKEKKWLKRSHKIIKDVMAKLKDVYKHEPRFIDNQNNDYKLIAKITDSLVMLEIRIEQIQNQSPVDTHSSDDSETEESSEKRGKACGNKQVGENESSSDEESGFTRKSHRHQHDFKLLYECSLILEIERDNFSMLYTLIEDEQCVN